MQCGLERLKRNFLFALSREWLPRFSTQIKRNNSSKHQSYNIHIVTIIGNKRFNTVGGYQRCIHVQFSKVLFF